MQSSIVHGNTPCFSPQMHPPRIAHFNNWGEQDRLVCITGLSIVTRRNHFDSLVVVNMHIKAIDERDIYFVCHLKMLKNNVDKVDLSQMTDPGNISEPGLIYSKFISALYERAES